MMRHFAAVVGCLVVLSSASLVAAEEDYVPSGNTQQQQMPAAFRFPTAEEQYDIDKLAVNIEAANFTGVLNYSLEHCVGTL